VFSAYTVVKHIVSFIQADSSVKLAAKGQYWSGYIRGRAAHTAASWSQAKLDGPSSSFSAEPKQHRNGMWNREKKSPD
jgi:hypothetical protein